jgi:hypothetical protein
MIYYATCPHCGYNVRGLSVRGIECDTHKISEIATCMQCEEVLSAEIAPIRARLKEYIRQNEETLVRMKSRDEKYVGNLKRRVDELKEKVRTSKATPQERARYSRALEMLKVAEPQDVTFLEMKLAAAKEALKNASDGPFLHSCGTELVVHEDTPNGYLIACPKCKEPMVVRLQDENKEAKR